MFWPDQASPDSDSKVPLTSLILVFGSLPLGAFYEAFIDIDKKFDIIKLWQFSGGANPQDEF